MVVAIVAIIMLGIMMYVLLKNKVSPVVAFSILPLIAGLALIFLVGYSGPKGEVLTTGQQIGQLFYKWAAGGVKTTMSNAVLFIFSIIYFGLMSDAGMFDPIVKGLTKISGSSPVKVYITTTLIAFVSQLDGATATTYLITIPAMLPLYKKMKLNVLSMLTLMCVITGSWNMTPWGGTIIRTATSVTNLGMPTTPQALWLKILPIEILGSIIGIALAVFFGMKDKRRIDKEYGPNFLKEMQVTGPELTEEESALKRPNLLIFNLLLTAVIIGSMIVTKIPAYLAFMLGTAVAVAVNYKGTKEQSERIEAHAPTAVGTAATFLCAGVFLGVFKDSGMTLAIANIILGLLPKALLVYTGRIVGCLGPIVGLVFSPDLYYYSLLPVLGEVVKAVGGNVEKCGLAMLIGENIGVPISPCVPTTFLEIGLAGVTLKDHILYYAKYCVGVSCILILVAVMLGVA
jgi:CitMHS family citrate-Mg2+:H+ or citrate-Ca2+:H+ symporter